MDRSSPSPDHSSPVKRGRGRPKGPLISPVGNQSSVPNPVSPAVERASFSPVVSPPYPAPPSFAEYRSVGYPPSPYPYAYPPPTSCWFHTAPATSPVPVASHSTAPPAPPEIWSPRHHAYSHNPLEPCHPESCSFHGLTGIVVPSSQEAVTMPSREVESYSFLKIEDNDDPSALLSGDGAGPLLRRGSEVSVVIHRVTFVRLRLLSTLLIGKAMVIEMKKTEQSSSKRKDRDNSELLDESKKGPVNERSCVPKQGLPKSTMEARELRMHRGRARK
ncbi:hypothetical protein QC760_010615 [Botrytis cinerea]